jgi:pimeloyl-ACP methyl ester carboxylesterase
MEVMADSIPTAATGSQASSLHHAFIRTLLLSQSSEGYISLCQAIAGADADAFRGITSPLLVIAGEDDRTANMDSVSKIMDWYVPLLQPMHSFITAIRSASNTPSSTLEVIPGVGHWHCIEAADAVTPLLRDFGRNLTAASKASEAQRS